MGGATGDKLANLSVATTIPSFSSKRRHLTEKHVLIGHQLNMLGNQISVERLHDTFHLLVV